MILLKNKNKYYNSDFSEYSEGIPTIKSLSEVAQISFVEDGSKDISGVILGNIVHDRLEKLYTKYIKEIKDNALSGWVNIGDIPTKLEVLHSADNKYQVEELFSDRAKLLFNLILGGVIPHAVATEKLSEFLSSEKNLTFLEGEYLKHLSNILEEIRDNTKIIFTEPEMSFVLIDEEVQGTKISLSLRVDFIIMTEDSLIIIEIKTGSEKPTKHKIGLGGYSTIQKFFNKKNVHLYNVYPTYFVKRDLEECQKELVKAYDRSNQEISTEDKNIISRLITMEQMVKSEKDRIQDTLKKNEGLVIDGYRIHCSLRGCWFENI